MALLWAQPRALVCVDSNGCPEEERLAGLAGRTEVVFRRGDVREVDLAETDLLFLDTHLDGGQLAHLAGRAKKYLVLHGTAGHAVEELLAGGAFRLRARHENNGGLSVLERA